MVDVRQAGSIRIALTLALATLGGAVATPALANSSAAEYFRARAASSNVPALLSTSEKEYYQQLFRAIDREKWDEVDGLLKRSQVSLGDPTVGGILGESVQVTTLTWDEMLRNAT